MILLSLFLSFSSFGADSYCPNANGKCCFQVGEKNEQCMCVLHPKDKPSPLQSCFYSMSCDELQKPGTKSCPSTCIYEATPPQQCNFEPKNCSIIKPCVYFNDKPCYSDYITCLKNSVDQDAPIRKCYLEFVKCIADVKKDKTGVDTLNSSSQSTEK
jgi:hypothetical protein